MKKLTTFQVARILDVSDQSVANWIDSGQIVATRTPGGHRRIEREDLLAFLRQRKLAVPAELLPAVPTVLIVDDEKGVADWLAQTLRMNCPDLRVLIANDGYTAGQIVTAERPDLVILDLFMPGMDGFEVCRKIKTDRRTQSTVVLAITAHPSPETEKAIRDAGASAYLPKPVDSTTISEMTRQLMAGAS